MLVAVLGFLVFGMGFAQEDDWRNTETTTRLWKVISEKRSEELASLILQHQKEVLSARSEDGRGALFWAWEYSNEEALAIFINFGVDVETKEMKDADGTYPMMMAYDAEPLLEKAKALAPTWKNNIGQIIQQMEEMRKKQEMEKVQYEYENDEGDEDAYYQYDEEAGTEDDSEKEEEGLWDFEEDDSNGENFRDELR